MGWVFDRNLATAPFTVGTGGSAIAAVEGKVLWVLTTGNTSKLRAYDILFAHMQLEPDENILVSRPTQYMGTFLDVELDFAAKDIVAYNDKAYIAAASNGYSMDQIQIVDIVGATLETITFPEPFNSNVEINNNKIWVVGTNINTQYQQSLMWYDIATKQFFSYPIPVRHQSQKRFISRDYNGNILICDFNNLSVTKFTNEGVYVSTTRTSAGTGGANREPDYIALDASRNVYVSSYNGMIQKFDSSADTFASYSNGLGDVHSFVDDGTYMWVASEKIASIVAFNGKTYQCTDSHIARGTEPDPTKWNILTGGEAAKDGNWSAGNYYVDDKEDVIRINKSDQSIRHFGTSERDIQIEDLSPSMINTKVNKVIMSQEMVCATAVGNVTLPQYVWLLTASSVIGVPTSSMFRQNYYEMNGVAMMSLGNYDYTGD